MANILIIEDDLLMQKVSESILRREGHNLTIVTDGKAAFEHLDNDTHYDLVITDILIPFATGYEVVAKVKQSPNPVPVIIVSSQGDDAAIEKGMQLGADDYLTKPVVGSELLARVKKYLG